MTCLRTVKSKGDFLKKRLAAIGVTSAALIATLATSSPAQAADAHAVCATAGAIGDITVFNYGSATRDVAYKVSVTDTDGDDHHVRIRLISKNHAGTVKRWAWHANTGGKNTSKTWTSVAHEDTGIHDVGVQVARFEKNRLLNSCVDWA